MSEEDLVTMIKTAQQEILHRKDAKRELALQKVLAAAQEAGMTPQELAALVAKGKRRGKRGVVAWQHPDDPTKVYRGGKKPDWLKELEAEGRKAAKVE